MNSLQKVILLSTAVLALHSLNASVVDKDQDSQQLKYSLENQTLIANQQIKQDLYASVSAKLASTFKSYDEKFVTIIRIEDPADKLKSEKVIDKPLDNGADKS